MIASLVAVTSILLDRFPEFTDDLQANVMNDDAKHTGQIWKESDEPVTRQRSLLSVANQLRHTKRYRDCCDEK